MVWGGEGTGWTNGVVGVEAAGGDEGFAGLAQLGVLLCCALHLGGPFLGRHDVWYWCNGLS